LTALARDPSSWKGAKKHPALIDGGMLKEYALNPKGNPGVGPDHDFFDLQPFRLPGWNNETGLGWTKLEITVEAVDTDVLTEPHSTTTRETFTFLVVSENELVKEIFTEEEKKHDELRALLDSLRDASKRLDPWVTNLNGDGPGEALHNVLQSAGGELQRIEGTIHTGELDARKINRDFQRIVEEMIYNRLSADRRDPFSKNIAKPMSLVFGDLKEGQDPKDRKDWNFLPLRERLRTMRVPLDPENLKALAANPQELKNLTVKTRDNVITTRDRLDEMIRELKTILDALQGVTNDQKLIAYLVAIEQNRQVQSEKLRDLHTKAENEVLRKLGLLPGDKPMPEPKPKPK
jgi:acyl-CoA hydrolase